MPETEKKRRNAPQTAQTNDIAPQPERQETEIDLLELFYYLLGHIWQLVGAALAGSIVFLLVSVLFLHPKYEATSKLYVTSRTDSAVNLSDLQIGTYLTSDYQEVFRTWEVHEQVLRNLGLDYSYTTLNDMVSVTNPADTRLLNITVTSEDPVEATNMANEYANVACDYIYQVMGTEEPRLFSEALQPTSPVSPNKTRNTILGGLLGGLLLAAVYVVRFILDDKIKTSDDISKYLGMPTLAIVPAIGAQKNAKRSVWPKERQGR